MWGRGPNSFFYIWISNCLGFPGSPAGKESACNARDHDSIPGSRRSPGEGIVYPNPVFLGSLVSQTVKKPLHCGRSGFKSWVGKILWRRAWQPTLVFWPGESPWTEEPGVLQSMRSQRVGHDWVTKHSTAHPIVLVIFTEEIVLSPWELSW